MASNDLTPKQEAFARGFFEKGNAAEAYRQSYDVSENSRDSWLYVEACQLLDNPKVALRIKELRAQAEKLSIYTRQNALEELEKARALAHKEGQSGGAVSAVSAKIKLLGFDRPDRLEVSGPNGEPLRITRIERTFVDSKAEDG